MCLRPHIKTGTINVHVYMKESVKKRLIPFILQHHKIEEVIFWPDMVILNFTKHVTEYLAQENFDFISKTENAPNVPQACGIQNFWALCKSTHSQRQIKPKNLAGFKKVLGLISRIVAQVP